ncbi:MAG: hypothetical protein HY299_20730 [Verrucomicrobia bacterium]|nr:hypothetical protein [Verrucomicrobiota bacterium]
MNSSRFKIRSPYRLPLYVTLGLLWATGAVWWGIALSSSGEAAPNATLSHEIQRWMLRSHGAGAMAALLALGAIIPIHIVRAWKAGKNRGSGLIIAAALGLLIATGYGLYYHPSVEGRGAMEWAHEALGLPLPLILLAHIWRGRRLMRDG